MVLIIVLVAVLIALAALQTQRHLSRVRRIPTRILVNGTRGKTSVTRLLAAALKEDGRAVLAKTTGSEACYVLPDGSIEGIKRTMGLSILRETIALFRKAVELNADTVVIECMAVRPESQVLLSSMVRPTVSVVTNARIDHIDVMGDSIKSTAEVLKLSVPTGSRFYTSDNCFEYDDDAIIVPDSGNASERNQILVLRILNDLGVKEDVARAGMAKFVPDMGLVGPFEIGGHHVVNAFAANDMQSSEEVLNEIGDLSDATIVYNNRADREFRLTYFAKVFSEFVRPHVIVVGDHTGKCVKYLSNHVIDSSVQAFSGSDEELLKLCRGTVICMGNIKGRGMDFIRYCQNSGEEV